MCYNTFCNILPVFLETKYKFFYEERISFVPLLFNSNKLVQAVEATLEEGQQELPSGLNSLKDIRGLDPLLQNTSLILVT